MATRKLKALPKQVYVKLETNARDPSDCFLVADVTLENLADGERVGIYELKETRTVHVTRELT